MNRRRLFYFLSTICAAMLVSVATAQTNPQNAQQEIQLGKQALAQGKYDDAIQHFENANNMVQNNAIMQLDLANAFAQKYVPGVDNADNERVADQAISYYQRVLDDGTSRISAFSAAKGTAFLFAEMNKFDESKDYYAKAKKINSQDPEPYYLTAVIDWTQSNQFRQHERTKLKLKPEDSLAAKDHDVCLTVKDKNGSNLADALDNLKQALELNPDYVDAMTYMSLVYRERADIECDEPATRKTDLLAADEWDKKALLAKKKAAQSKGQSASQY
jgi:tetratricopeptide (TPR) repeat protein